MQIYLKKRALKLALALSILPLLAGAPSSQAAITFVFDYSGNTAGVGFLDASLGLARRNALDTAASGFSSLFSQYFSNTGTIRLDVTSNNSPGSSTLASAGSQYVNFGSDPDGFTLGEVVRTKLQTGFDRNGPGADGTLNVNFGKNWELDPNAQVNENSDNEFDFYATMYHEFMHAIGFASSFDESGNPVFGDKNSGGIYSVFDSFIETSDGTRLIAANGTLNLSQSIFDAAVIGGVVDGVFFGGANAKAANGGNAVGIYSPNPYKDGSSLSHLDDQNPALAGLMMLATTGPGTGTRTLSAIEVGILQDIGYSPVPVPAAVWLFGSVAALVFGLGKRKQGEIS